MDTKNNTNDITATIAALNDEFRSSTEGFTITRGIAAMGDAVSEVVAGVRNFSDFTEDNDPYGEHDFGSLSVQGERIFWKMDYYDESLSRWCDPLDSRCRRVLTILLAEEY